MRCEGYYRDHITREISDCEDEAEPNSVFCRDCQGEPEEQDPDWQWDMRHEWSRS